MKRISKYLKSKIVRVYNNKYIRLILNRLILILCIPIILLDVFLAMVILLKNWTLKINKEINNV